MLSTLLLGSALALQVETDPNVVVIALAGEPSHTINPLVYGGNDTPLDLPFTFLRYGGNATTTYNWETNFNNAGKDYLHSSGYGWPMRYTAEDRYDEPAAGIITHHTRALELGADTLIQVNVMGWVAADADGIVEEDETARSDRWVRVEPRKPGPFEFPPDRNDDVVYVDEMVAYLVEMYGPADSPTGIDAYSLDNEVGLWSETHPRAFPEHVRIREFVERSIETAKAIKDVDPTARIHGPNPFGVYSYMNLVNAPDWPEIQAEGDYYWFLDYYLDEFRKAEEEEGRRLLDVLDVHYYIEGQTVEDGAVEGIIQAPRSLWDPTYDDLSWLGEVYPEVFPLLPRLRASIDRYYPGTELCISEYNPQGIMFWYGGLAFADMLGAFGAHGVDSATFWGLLPSGFTPEQGQPAMSGFSLFRNYDGNGGTFGDQSHPVVNPAPHEVSAWASSSLETDDLHFVLISKRRHVPLQVVFPLPEGNYREPVRVFGFSADELNLREYYDTATVEAGNLYVELPPKTAFHVVLPRP